MECAIAMVDSALLFPETNMLLTFLDLMEFACTEQN